MKQDQLPLDDDRIAARFQTFHAENPHVYQRLRTMALRLKRRGRVRYGIAALFEVFRFETAVSTSAPDGLKLNNNYAALYARLLAQREPELRGFFSMRMRSPRWPRGQVFDPGDSTSPAVDENDQPLD